MFNTRPWLYYDSSYNVRKFGTKFWIYYDVSNITNKFKSTYIQGILDISGNVVLRNGNLYVGKSRSFTNIYIPIHGYIPVRQTKSTVP